jgi:hypothetical protein
MDGKPTWLAWVDDVVQATRLDLMSMSSSMSALAWSDVMPQAGDRDSSQR